MHCSSKPSWKQLNMRTQISQIKLLRGFNLPAAEYEVSVMSDCENRAGKCVVNLKQASGHHPSCLLPLPKSSLTHTKGSIFSVKNASKWTVSCGVLHLSDRFSQCPSFTVLALSPEFIWENISSLKPGTHFLRTLGLLTRDTYSSQKMHM